jgi:hypothetical protein
MESMMGVALFWIVIPIYFDVAVGKDFSSEKLEISPEIAEEMKRYSWKEGCPVPLERLAHLKLTHWGFDDQVHQGELVVHEEIADEVLAIFKDFFEYHVPIEKMHRIEVYQGDDQASMEDNNTSAFNCRKSMGNRTQHSKHSEGKAIDINPRYNPLVIGERSIPPSAKAFVDRKQKVVGMIHHGDAVQQAFRRRGWIWGGAWRAAGKDYQHFEKN